MTKLRIFLANLLHALSCLSPRDKHIWVFCGWHRTSDGEIFTDNTKYLYLFLNKNEPNIKAIWLAKNKNIARELSKQGYPAYYEKSILGIWFALRAGVTVLDAFMQQYTYQIVGKSKIVQLLHGKGMKKAGYAQLPFKKNDYIFLPSPFVEDILSEVFKKDSKIYITGYSRSDGIVGCDYEKMIHTNTDDLALLQSLHSKGSTCLWYAPTFRRGQTNFDVDTILDIKNLYPLLEEQNCHLFISLHPKYRSLKLNSSYERVHILAEQDFFPLYKYFSVLITDYSSSFADFLLLDRPIIFYPYDFDSYIKNEGISIDYDAVTPGPKAKNPQELRNLIAENIRKDTYQQRRLDARKQYHSFTDNLSSQRITNILKQELTIL